MSEVVQTHRVWGRYVVVDGCKVFEVPVVYEF